MCIQAPEIFSPHCLHCFKHLPAYHRKNMSFQKKNVILGFRKDEYVPTAGQWLVKYSTGKGNNLHEVECIDGSIVLVSMPKKYRHTVWLKREDCLVIDPIEEGKKVRGEIVCVLPFDTVRDLIVSLRWPIPASETEVDELIKFFTSTSNSERKSNREAFDAFPSTDSSDMESDGQEEEEEEGDEEAENDEEDPEEGNSESQSKATEGDNDTENSQSPGIPNDAEDSPRDRNRSRVQLVTSGIVTVTNVLTEGMENDMQSLEFGADEEESSDELNSEARDLQRHANTIRIQVNYNNPEN